MNTNEQKQNSECPSGQFTDQTEFHLGEENNQFGCKQCSIGKASSAGSSICVGCAVGMYGSAAGICSECATKSYQNEKGQTTCKACGTGQMDNGKTTPCSECAVGMYGSTAGVCVECGAGQYQEDQGQLKCTNCPINTYSEATKKSSAADCTKCPNVQITGKTTGANSRFACQCPKTNYYQRVVAGDEDDEDGGDNGDTVQCVECIEGADCSDHNGITLSELVALPGYWRPTKESEIFSKCSIGFSGTDEEKTKLSKERCCPLDPLTNVSLCANITHASFHKDQQCLEGYEGVLCMVCADQYVPQFTGCTQCKGGGQLPLVFLFLCILCIPLFAIVFIILLKSVKPEKIEDAGEQTSDIMGQVKIVITYVQIMSSMPGIMENVPWPSSFVSFSVPFTTMNLNWMGMVGNSWCSLSVPFQEKFLVHMAMPVLVSLTTWLAYVVSNVCGDREKKSYRSAQALKIFLFIVLFIYPGLCTAVFTMFLCKDIAGVKDGLVLVADFNVRCQQGEHVVYGGLGVFFGVLYVFGIPAYILYVLKKNRQHLYDPTSPKHEEGNSCPFFLSQFECCLSSFLFFSSHCSVLLDLFSFSSFFCNVQHSHVQVGWFVFTIRREILVV